MIFLSPYIFTMAILTSPLFWVPWFPETMVNRQR